MNTEKPLIKLYRTRSFSKKMSDTFDFVSENFHTLLKYITYLLLPVSLVQTFFMTNFMSGYIESITLIVSDSSADIEKMLPWVGSISSYMLVMFVGMLLLYALTYTMMQLYEQRPDRLQTVTFADMRSSIIRMCGRQLVLLVTGVVLMIVIGLAIGLMIGFSTYMILPAIIFVIVALPLFALVSPIYLFEDTGVVSAYAKSVRLGWKTWAGIVAVLTVLYIIGSIISGLISTPWYIMLMTKNILSAQGETSGFVSSFGYTAIQYLLGVVSSFCGLCAMGLMAVGLAYQYGHACDKVDGVGVDKDIENFETLNN